MVRSTCDVAANPAVRRTEGGSVNRWQRIWHGDVGYSFRTSPVAMGAAAVALGIGGETVQPRLREMKENLRSKRYT